MQISEKHANVDGYLAPSTRYMKAMGSYEFV